MMMMSFTWSQTTCGRDESLPRQGFVPKSTDTQLIKPFFALPLLKIA
jgi:hypothetical protein